MRVHLLSVAAIFLAGCSAPQFSIKEVDNRFSENKNKIFLSENNRISTKSIAGGLHIDNQGFFMNPFVEKNFANGEVVALGFRMINKSEVSSASGGVNRLGVIREVACRPSGGELIVLGLIDQKNIASDVISYNSVGGYASFESSESGVAVLSKKNFARLAEAGRLSCKVTGSIRSVVYEEKDISIEFLSNLKNFYTTHVK